MDGQEFLYFTYGMSIMFYGVMARMFFVRRAERLKALMSVLMCVLLLECVKDLFFAGSFYVGDKFESQLVTSFDVVVVPMYAFVLMELCRPGYLTRRTMVLHELPFLLMFVLFAATRSEIVYYVQIVSASAYGFFYAGWTLAEIPRYHRRMKERLSYSEHVNLYWLRAILISYFALLLAWMASCWFVEVSTDLIYLFLSLAVWLLTSFFIYQHETVMDELGVGAAEEADGGVLPESGGNGLEDKVARLFEEDKVYLNPELRLSDLARLVGTNRTYLSQYFNREANTSFHDYVNGMRTDHAERLLSETDLPMDKVAEMSGFGSKQTFYRMFRKRYGCTPAQFRGGGK